MFAQVLNWIIFWKPIYDFVASSDEGFQVKWFPKLLFHDNKKLQFLEKKKRKTHYNSLAVIILNRLR